MSANVEADFCATIGLRNDLEIDILHILK